MSTAVDLVTVASYETVLQAEAARGLLLGEGIRCFVTDGAVSTMETWVTTGGVGLQVNRPDAARAVEVLRAHEAAAREARGDEALVEDEADDACIACGAVIPEYLDRCPACGWSYS